MNLKKVFDIRKETETAAIMAPATSNEKAKVISSTEIIGKSHNEYQDRMRYAYFNVDTAIELYEDLLNDKDYELTYEDQMALVIELTEKIFIDLCSSDDEETGEQAAAFVKAVFIISQKYKLDFRKIIDKVILNKVFANESDKVMEYIFVWNFFTFESFLDLPYDDSSISYEDVVDTVSDIFSNYFVKFYENSDEKSIETLSKFARYPENYTDFEEEIIETIIGGDEFFDTSIAIYVAKYFPSLNYYILTWALESIKTELMAGELNEEDKGIFSDELINLLQNMGDYCKYQYYEYDIKRNWKEIIECIVKSLDGITLNRITDILCDSFGIPKSKIEECIKQSTMRTVQYLHTKNPVEKVNRLVSLMSNPVVMDVVKKEYEFILSLYEE